MKQTLLDKRIDLWVQIMCIPAGIACLFIPDGFMYAFYCYIGLGGLQVFSMLLNKFLLPAEVKAGGRIWYEWIILIAAVAGGIAILFKFGDLGYIMFAFLLFGSPLMALWYLALTALEIENVKNRIDELNNNQNTVL